MGEKSVSGEPVEPLIALIRGHRVIVDADLARVYGSSVKALNQAVRRNRARFPGDFAFQLSAAEHRNLRSQSVTSSLQVPKIKGEVHQPHGGRRYLPWAFTEHGALMAANVLRSARAVQMSVYVIRAFVQMRERLAGNDAFLKRLAEIDRTLLQHEPALRDIYRKLLPLLQPPPDPPKRRIGFHVGEEK